MCWSAEKCETIGWSVCRFAHEHKTKLNRGPLTEKLLHSVLEVSISAGSRLLGN